jgi:hypothetical protein
VNRDLPIVVLLCAGLIFEVVDLINTAPAQSGKLRFTLGMALACFVAATVILMFGSK